MANRRSRYVAVGAGVFAAGAASWLAFATLFGGGSVTPGLQSNLSITLNAVEAVIEAEITPDTIVAGDSVVHEVYQATVVDIALALSATQHDDPESVLEVPELHGGDVIQVSLTVTKGLWEGWSLSPGRSGLLLSYQDADADESGVPWEIQLVVDVEAASIIHPAAFDAQWRATMQVPVSLQALTDWLIEKGAVRSGVPPGPFEAAWGVSQGRPLREDVWERTDPRVRSFDPEEAPPELLAGLVEELIFIDIPPQVAAHQDADDFIFAIRTDVAVVYQTLLSVGSHPVSVLTPPGATWELVLLGPGALDGAPLGAVDADIRGASDALTIALPEGLSFGARQTGESQSVSVSGITRPSLADLIDETADTPPAGSVNPEP